MIESTDGNPLDELMEKARKWLRDNKLVREEGSDAHCPPLVDDDWVAGSTKFAGLGTSMRTHGLKALNQTSTAGLIIVFVVYDSAGPVGYVTPDGEIDLFSVRK